jgi:hypothetical protein
MNPRANTAEKPRAVPLDKGLQIQLRRLFDELGERETSVRLDVPASTLVRGVAGLPVRRATAFLIETRLARMGGQVAA